MKFEPKGACGGPLVKDPAQQELSGLYRKVKEKYGRDSVEAENAFYALLAKDTVELKTILEGEH